MRTRVATATGLLCIGVLLLAACGGGSSTFAAPTGQMGVTMFSPGGTIQSEAQQPFMILGQGFGPVGDPCPIRVTATSGTPFRMGTSATLEGPGYIEASDCIRGVLEAAQILPTTGPVTATVDLILPDGSTFPLEGVTATFAELDYQLKILSISPDAGAAWGYEQVTLQGCGFSRYDPGTPRVWFGGREATEVVVQSDTTLTCRTAPNALGFVDVRIANDYADFELISGFEHPWLCAWDWEYGARHAGLSNRDHPYYNYPCPAGFRFSWRGGLASNIRISGGWIYPYVPGVGHQGTIGHLGSCLDTWAPDANIHLKQLPNRLVITYENVRWAHQPGSATSQLVLHEDGSIASMYRGVVGNSWAIYLSLYPYTTSYYVDWTSQPSVPHNAYVREYFHGGNAFDLEDLGLLWQPNAAGGFDTTVFFADP